MALVSVNQPSGAAPRPKRVAVCPVMRLFSRYARAFASYRMEKKSRRQLEYELLKRGIDKEVIREVLSSLYEGVDESALIAAYLEKKLGGTLPGCLPDRSDEKAWAKLYRHLTGRGYTMENIKRAISHFT